MGYLFYHLDGILQNTKFQHHFNKWCYYIVLTPFRRKNSLIIVLMVKFNGSAWLSYGVESFVQTLVSVAVTLKIVYRCD